VANEWEFQGDVLKWMGQDIAARAGLGIGDVGQEKTPAAQKRSDIIVWTTRDLDALADVELKTPSTPLSDKAFQNDVIKKARQDAGTDLADLAALLDGLTDAPESSSGSERIRSTNTCANLRARPLRSSGPAAGVAVS
jgi:hypothetical protein